MSTTPALKSITADRRLEWTGTRDADNTPLLILHTNYTSESDQFSQEFQAVRRYRSRSMASSDSTTSTRIPSTVCWSRWAIPAPRMTRSASRWTPRPRRCSPNGRSSSPTPSAPPPASATRRKPRDCRPSCSTWRRQPRPNRRAHRAVSVRGSAAHADRLPVPHDRRFERDFSSTTKSASVQYRFNEQRHDLPELVGRLQEWRL